MVKHKITQNKNMAAIRTKSLYSSTEDVITNTFINGDLDTDKLIPYIKRAQELYLIDRLGQALYNHLDNLIDTDEINDAGNEDYLTLAVEYIAPCVDYWAAAEFIRFGGYQVADNGVFKKTAENATPASRGEIIRLIDALQSTAENLWSIADDLLCNQSSRYPEYNQANGEQRPSSFEVYSMDFM